MQLIHLRAPNDTNGNPRRSWILLNEIGIAVDCFDEGYSGTNAVPPELNYQRMSAPAIRVSVKELNVWRKAAAANKQRKASAVAA